MKNKIWTGMFTSIVGLATVAITAQTPTPPQANAASTDRKITVTGCLKEAPENAGAAAAATGTAGTTAGAVGTAGTTGTTATAGTAGTTGETAASTAKFILTNAAPSPAADPSAAAATAAAPVAGAAAAPPAQTYRLIANATALSPHVGKKLELTGTLEEPGSATAPAGSSAAGAESAVASLRVESGKIIAASCSE